MFGRAVVGAKRVSEHPIGPHYISAIDTYPSDGRHRWFDEAIGVTSVPRGVPS
ncbi:hypothetical protein Rcae01_01845 [Novipirellula caenicola]|uniref:Uncharacterized protein n=1 Tax=Novipirellula caenicola TaxID=1536901 RepID=A0ABP9VRJ3_9BACT